MKTLVSRTWKRLWMPPPRGFVDVAVDAVAHGVSGARWPFKDIVVLVLTGLAATLHNGVHAGYDIGHLQALGAVQSGGYGGHGGGGYGGGHGVPIVKVGYVKKPYVSIG
ncbi:unnamed protein product, partial [Ixodes hexagonus]